MCGIAGIVGPQHFDVNTQQVLHSIAHRGPDYSGEWQDSFCWLGHNRLSIIDLSAAGNQPMHSHCGRYVIVLNGEIYNYKELCAQYLQDRTLRSSGDTEILLELYALRGKAILNELIGMFAFAVWDKEERTLFAARDRFGVKPFYYALHHENFLFASEIKTLWVAGIPKEANQQVWSSFFMYGTYGMPYESFWNGIQALQAGTWLEWNEREGKLHTEKWYEFEANIQKLEASCAPEQRLAAYPDLLIEAVRLRFRSDVPVGVAVSGGLDSSLLLSTIQKAFDSEKALEAFTFYCNNPAYDELPYVEQLTRDTPIHLNEVLLDYKKVAMLALQMSHLQDEPFGGMPTLAYANIFSEAQKRKITVLLDGQGMDEAWAGYDYYWNNSNDVVQATTTSPTRPATLEPGFAALASPLSFPAPFNNRLQNLQYRDLFYTKLPRALRFNDRASMMYSIELREPFLDHRLVETAFSLPASMKHQNNLSKFALRQIAENWIGGQLALAPKRALQTPQREWLKHELKEWAMEKISWLAHQGNPGWFNGQEMENAFKAFAGGEADNSFYVWQWINTAILLEN